MPLLCMMHGSLSTERHAVWFEKNCTAYPSRHLLLISVHGACGRPTCSRDCHGMRCCGRVICMGTALITFTGTADSLMTSMCSAGCVMAF